MSKPHPESLRDVLVETPTSTESTLRPANVVTYFGDYASAIRAGDRYVHIFRDGDRETFCGVLGDLSFGIPRVVGQLSRSSCLSCFADCQQVRRDG